NQHFNENLSGWERIKKAVGGEVYPNIDEGSYLSAKITPKLEEAILKQRQANKSFSNSNADNYREPTIYPAIDLNIDGYSRNTGILSRKSYSFESVLNIDGETIPFSAVYTVKNRQANYINRVDANSSTFTTWFGPIQENPVMFLGKGVRPAVMLNLQSKSDQQ